MSNYPTKTFKRRAILEALAREEFPEMDTSRIVFRIHSYGEDFCYLIHNGEEQDIDILVHKKFFSGLEDLRKIVKEMVSQAMRDPHFVVQTEEVVNIRDLAPDKESSPKIAGTALHTLIENAGPEKARTYLRMITSGEYDKHEWLEVMASYPYLSRRLALALWHFGKENVS